MIPVLVSQLTDSKLVIGLVRALWAFGYYFPQLLTANMAESMPYKKPFVMLVGAVCERLPYLLVGLAVLFFAVSTPWLALAAVLFGIGLASSGAGLTMAPWLDLIAKVIPVQRRGIWLGLGQGLGQLMGVGGAYFVGRILVDYAFPSNFALLFFLAFAFTAVSWVGLALNREPRSEVTKKAAPFYVYLSRLTAVLKRDQNYRRYLISKSLMILGGMGTGFYAVYGAELFALDGRGIGLLTAVLVGTQAVLNPLCGLLADRAGHKVVLDSSALFSVLASSGALLVSGLAYPGTDWVQTSGTIAGQAGQPDAGPVWETVPFGLLLTFISLGAFLGAYHTSSLPISLEFSVPEDRPTYVGLTHTILAPVLVGGPILGGWLAGAWGFTAMFSISLAFGVVALFLMLFWVREPRRTKPYRVE